MASPNRSRARRRPKVYDARDIAIDMRETFTDRPWESETEFPWDWPPVMQNVGDSLGVAYGSDKWKKPKKNGRRDIEIYKHIAESRNRIFVLPGTIVGDGDDEFHCIGPLVGFDTVPMPKHFATLAYFKECNVQLYTGGTDRRPRFGDNEDDGIVTLTVRHGMLGGSKIRWSEEGGGRDQPFLFVYTARDGVLFVIVGEKLDVLKDGIVG